jgi:hypothetical protein
VDVRLKPNATTYGTKALRARAVRIHTKFPGVTYIHTESLSAPPVARHIVHVIGVDITRITGTPSAT